mgnify:CR=1 FL=1
MGDFVKELLERIVKDPIKGRLVIKGTNATVELILTRLATGAEPEEIAKDYGITLEDIRAALLYAALILPVQCLDNVLGVVVFDLIRDKAGKLHVDVVDLVTYLLSLITTTSYYEAEIKAIPIAKRFIKERYGVEPDGFIKVEQLPWDLQFYVQDKFLVLVEVGKHNITEIKEKIAKTHIYLTKEDLAKYEEIVWIHIDAKTMKIDSVEYIKRSNTAENRLIES